MSTFKELRQSDVKTARSYGKIYLIECIENNKKYVGQTTRSLKDRWISHVKTANSAIKKFAIHNAINKYGASSFKISLLEDCKNKQELNDLERKWINQLNTLAPNGYNLTSGGEKYDGFKLSTETKHKIAASLLDKKHTEERKKAMSTAAKNRKISDVGRLSLSFAREGNTNRQAPKPVDQLDLNSNFIRSFQSLTAASEFLTKSKKSVGNISAACKGINKTSCGFKWRFSNVNV